MSRSQFVLAALLVSATTMASEVGYREIFPTGPHVAANRWHLNHSANAWVGDKDPSWGAAPGAGSSKAINSLSAAEDDLEGWKGFIWLAPTSPEYLLWTAECRFASGSIERIAWRFSAKDPAATLRVALRLDNQWYASSQTFSEATGGAITAAREFSLELATSTWIPFSWQANTRLPGALDGTAAALPAGAVDAFGFLGVGRTQTHSFDAIEVFTTRGTADVTPIAN